MFKLLHNLFLLFVFLSGIVIGGLYTPGVIAYSQSNESDNIEQKAPKPIKTRPSPRIRQV